MKPPSICENGIVTPQDLKPGSVVFISDEGVNCGKYRISDLPARPATPNHVWIKHENGEGMSFPRGKLSALFDWLWKDF